ncbi:MAG: hypothetical protein OXI24_06455, partial [Candidatus Poribacteria bacterium]|nr:hypothetical protein [Candidatus Poribacteria bacterium]
ASILPWRSLAASITAAGHGHVETTQYLVEHGADLQARLSDGKTVVEWLKQYADNDLRLKSCLNVLER